STPIMLGQRMTTVQFPPEFPASIFGAGETATPYDPSFSHMATTNFPQRCLDSSCLLTLRWTSREAGGGVSIIETFSLLRCDRRISAVDHAAVPLCSISLHVETLCPPMTELHVMLRPPTHAAALVVLAASPHRRRHGACPIRPRPDGSRQCRRGRS